MITLDNVGLYDCAKVLWYFVAISSGSLSSNPSGQQELVGTFKVELLGILTSYKAKRGVVEVEIIHSFQVYRYHPLAYFNIWHFSYLRLFITLKY